MKRVVLVALLGLTSAGCSKPNRSAELRAEVVKRQNFARKVAEDADAGRMLEVASSADAIFDDGFSAIMYDPPDDFHNHAFRWMGKNAHVRLHVVDGAPKHLVVAGWAHEKVIRAKPVISAYIDGTFIATTNAIEDGHFRIDVTVTPDLLKREWVDLNLFCNAVSFHWGEPPDLRVLVLYHFEWQ